MFDIKAIRENPAEFDTGWARRGLSAQTPEILLVDEKRRAVQTRLQDLQEVRNFESKKIGQLKGQGEHEAAQTAMDAVAKIKDDMAALEEEERGHAEALNNILSALPNIMDADVPDGADEDENVEVHKWGTPRADSDQVPEHFEIGEKLGLMDFETAAKMSGSRFVILSGALARLERALAQFFLDTHTAEHGYTEVSPPLMIKTEAMYGTGQLPKFEDDQFKTTRGDWLVPTSEVPLTNIVREEIVEQETLPRRYTAFTPCFRQEAGASGKDTRGMIRQHQFYKVEMVGVTAPEESEAEHERMRRCAETILEKLEIPYRTIVLCTGDTGFTARKTYDLEAWLPGQGRFREISSVSNCGDFQARRMNARTRPKGEKNTRFVHTLNGSGVAVGRTLIAVMENYYDPEDGGINIPEVLKPYMGGLEKITA